jgi:S-adenosylmethionine hydrolase
LRAYYKEQQKKQKERIREIREKLFLSNSISSSHHGRGGKAPVEEEARKGEEEE